MKIDTLPLTNALNNYENALISRDRKKIKKAEAERQKEYSKIMYKFKASDLIAALRSGCKENVSTNYKYRKLIELANL